MKQMIESFKTFLEMRKKNKKARAKPTVVRTALVGGAYYYQGVGSGENTSGDSGSDGGGGGGE